MIEEELPDELENDLDDIEPVGDESQLYEHFRVVVDKGQAKSLKLWPKSLLRLSCLIHSLQEFSFQALR